MRGLVELRWFKFGDRYLRQEAGIPIGGPVSGAVLEAVLSVDEFLFERFGWDKYAQFIGITGPGEHWIAIGRYVDDVIVLTRWLCADCVESLITTSYGRAISFDKACDELTVVCAFASVKFLDIYIYMNW